MIRGGLFTRYFLEDGIRETDAYRSLEPGDITGFVNVVRSRWANLADMRHPSEAETEAELIYPILKRLGWEHLPQQEPGKGRKDIADALLFLSGDDKAKARRLHQTADRFRLGVVVVENEARDTPLDRSSGKAEAPSSQLLRYLIRAQTQSRGSLQWGLLTSGRYWRLYWANARARAEGFIEFELPALLTELAPPTPAGADPKLDPGIYAAIQAGILGDMGPRCADIPGASASGGPAL